MLFCLEKIFLLVRKTKLCFTTAYTENKKSNKQERCMALPTSLKVGWGSKIRYAQDIVPQVKEINN